MLPETSALSTQCNAKNAQILNNYFDDSTQLDIAKKINEVALLASQKNWTDKQIDVAIADIAQKYSQVALNNSIARLNNQEFQFNEDTRDLRISGLTQDNLGKLYDNDQKRYSLKMLRSTFGYMVKSAISEYKYNSIFYQGQEQGLNDLYNTNWWWNRWTNVLGGGLRNAASGILNVGIKPGGK